MPFANPLMLIGLSAILIPIILHLFNRRKAQSVDWGAMQFLLGSVVGRNRRILLEEALLLALRCILLALLALALALPFVPPGSAVPWQVVLPALLIGAGALGAGTALWEQRAWRWGLCGAGIFLILFAVSMGLLEHRFQLRLWKTSGQQDVAIVIDGSASMTIMVDGKSNFDRAVEDARTVVKSMGSQDAASIIVAGSRPLVKTAAPIARREQLEQILSELRPTGGAMAVRDALTAAAMTLAGGQNLDKKVILLTDGQALGWKEGGQVDWKSLAGAFAGLKTPPRVAFRYFPTPGSFQNVAVTQVTLSRRIVGPDRPVAISARIENTGKAPVNTQFNVVLTVDNGEKVLPESITRLNPGASEVVTFHYRFTRGGLHSLEVKAVLDDDLASDNTSVRVIQTLDRLPVLLVEGNPSPAPEDRTSWFLAAALAPDPESSGLVDGGGTWGNPFVDLTVIDAPRLIEMKDFSRFQAVILADVPQLPLGTATALGQFVQAGGGLLIIPGERCLPQFYDEWKTPAGFRISPAALGDRYVAVAGRLPAHPSVNTFHHPALQVFVDDAQCDIGSANVTAFWRLKADGADQKVSVCGKLDSGDPFLVERHLGKGRVLMTALSLDRRSGNLHAKNYAFVRLVYEMVQELTELPSTSFEFDPNVRLDVAFEEDGKGPAVNTDAAAVPASGLAGEYFADSHFHTPALSRVDGGLNFAWGAGSPGPGVPADHFSARWTGSIVPTVAGVYTFELQGDDRAELWINGKSIVTAAGGATEKGTVELAANQPHDIRVELADDAGPATCQVWWSAPGVARQPLPPQTIFPRRAWARLGDALGSAELQSPAADAPRLVSLGVQDGRMMAHVGQALQPGLYRLTLPETVRPAFSREEIGDAAFFSVRNSPEESRLTVLSSADFTDAGKYMKFLRTDNVNDLVRILSDGLPGQRLWKYLMMAALAALLLESGLARWIAFQRRLGAEPDVDFSPVAAEIPSFRKTTEEMFARRGSEESRT